MKKFVSVILLCVMVYSLCSCENNANNEQSVTKSNNYIDVDLTLLSNSFKNTYSDYFSEYVDNPIKNDENELIYSCWWIFDEDNDDNFDNDEHISCIITTTTNKDVKTISLNVENLFDYSNNHFEEIIISISLCINENCNIYELLQNIKIYNDNNETVYREYYDSKFKCNYMINDNLFAIMFEPFENGKNKINTIKTETYKAEDFKEEIAKNIILQIPTEWSAKHEDKSAFYYYYNNEKEFLMVSFDEIDNKTTKISDEYFSSYLEGVKNANENATDFALISKNEIINDNDIKFKTALYTQNINKNPYKVYLAVALESNQIVSLCFAQLQNSKIDYQSIFDEIINTASFDEDRVHEGYKEKTTQQITTFKKAKKSTSLGQKNALEKAYDYLEYSAFSYKGLVEQLEYEGFTHEEAIYAADNCGADWKEQAAKKAKDYLEYYAFSKSELIEQLEYDGFTYEQAIYGVEANGY